MELANGLTQLSQINARKLKGRRIIKGSGASDGIGETSSTGTYVKT